MWNTNTRPRRAFLQRWVAVALVGCLAAEPAAAAMAQVRSQEAEVRNNASLRSDFRLLTSPFAEQAVTEPLTWVHWLREATANAWRIRNRPRGLAHIAAVEAIQPGSPPSPASPARSAASTGASSPATATFQREIWLWATDKDETLLDYHKNISWKTRRLMSRLVSLNPGVFFGIISGSTTENIDETVTRHLAQRARQQLYVYGDYGGETYAPQTYDPQKGRQGPPLLQRFLKDLDSNDFEAIRGVAVQAFETAFERKPILISDDNKKLGIVVSPACLTLRTPHTTAAFKEQIKHQILGELQRLSLKTMPKVDWSGSAVDITLIDKEEALQHLADHVAAERSTPEQRVNREDVLQHTVAMGDSHNDVPMLNLVARAGGIAYFVGEEWQETLDPRVIQAPRSGPRGVQDALQAHIDWLEGIHREEEILPDASGSDPNLKTIELPVTDLARKPHGEATTARRVGEDLHSAIGQNSSLLDIDRIRLRLFTEDQNHTIDNALEFLRERHTHPTAEMTEEDVTLLETVFHQLEELRRSGPTRFGGFRARVRGPENYLLAFASKTRGVSRGRAGFSFELVNRLTGAENQEVLAEILFHEGLAVIHPERTLVGRGHWEKVIHQERIAGIQRRIFGEKNRVQPVLRELISDLSLTIGQLGGKVGQLKEQERVFQQELHTRLLLRGVAEPYAERVARAVTRMLEGSLQKLEIWGVLSPEDVALVLSKQIKPRALKRLSGRLAALVEDYVSAGYKSSQLLEILKRLVPRAVFERLSEDTGLFPSLLSHWIWARSDFETSLYDAQKRIAGISPRVGGPAKAWVILNELGNNADKIEERILATETIVEEFGAEIGPANALELAFKTKANIDMARRWVECFREVVPFLRAHRHDHQDPWRDLVQQRRLEPEVVDDRVLLEDLRQHLGSRFNAWLAVAVYGPKDATRRISQVEPWIEDSIMQNGRDEAWRNHLLANLPELALGSDPNLKSVASPVTDLARKPHEEATAAPAPPAASSVDDPKRSPPPTEITAPDGTVYKIIYRQGHHEYLSDQTIWNPESRSIDIYEGTRWVGMADFEKGVMREAHDHLGSGQSNPAICVNRNDRRRGVGTLLMALAFLWAQQEGHARFRVRAVDSPARPFFESLGMTSVGPRDYSIPLTPEELRAQSLSLPDYRTALKAGPDRETPTELAPGEISAKGRPQAMMTWLGKILYSYLPPWAAPVIPLIAASIETIFFGIAFGYGGGPVSHVPLHFDLKVTAYMSLVAVIFTYFHEEVYKGRDESPSPAQTKDLWAIFFLGLVFCAPFAAPYFGLPLFNGMPLWQSALISAGLHVLWNGFVWLLDLWGIYLPMAMMGAAPRRHLAGNSLSVRQLKLLEDPALEEKVVPYGKSEPYRKWIHDIEGVTIESAVQKDLLELLSLRENWFLPEVMDELGWYSTSQDRAEQEQDKREMLEHLRAVFKGEEPGVLLVAKQNGRVVGYGLSRITDSGIAYMAEMAVHPSVRGYGIAKALIAERVRRLLYLKLDIEWFEGSDATYDYASQRGRVIEASAQFGFQQQGTLRHYALHILPSDHARLLAYLEAPDRPDHYFRPKPVPQSPGRSRQIGTAHRRLESAS